jgi:hypothetical protein
MTDETGLQHAKAASAAFKVITGGRHTYHRSATWKTSSGSPIEVHFIGPAEERAKIDEQFERVRKTIEKETKP